MIPVLVTKAGRRGRHRPAHTIRLCALHSEERCWRYCSQDGRCWLVSRGGLYHFPVAFYFNAGKSSWAPDCASASPSSYWHLCTASCTSSGDWGWLAIQFIYVLAAHMLLVIITIMFFAFVQWSGTLGSFSCCRSLTSNTGHFEAQRVSLKPTGGSEHLSRFSLEFPLNSYWMFTCINHVYVLEGLGDFLEL